MLFLEYRSNCIQGFGRGAFVLKNDVSAVFSDTVCKVGIDQALQRFVEQVCLIRRVGAVAMCPNLDPVTTYLDQPPRFSRDRDWVPRGTQNDFVGEQGEHLI